MIPSHIETEKGFVLLRRRRTATLIKWWRELNSWGWPKELLPAEDRTKEANPRRNRCMDAIACQLGLRVIIGRKK